MQVRNATRRTIRANKANQGMTRRLVGDEGKGVEHLANMHPVGVPGRLAARHAARIALRRLVRTRKTWQKDHDPEHRNSACRQCTTDLERITQVPGTGLIALNRDYLRACDAYRGNLPPGGRLAYASSAHRCG